MSPTAALILIALAVAAAAVIGFYTGRHTAPGKRQADSLQKELDDTRREMTEYRQSVNRHFEKTATLFTGMAGSYRDLYDHLRESYGALADSSERPLLPDHAGALLEGESTKGTPTVPPEASTPRETPPGTAAPAGGGGGSVQDSEDMLGDAPHIPADVELEEPPEQPVKARREEGGDARRGPGTEDAGAGPSGSAAGEGDAPPSSGDGEPASAGKTERQRA